MNRHANLSLRPAWSLLELLVTLAIVSLLVAVALPAIWAARGAARKATCQSNLRQLGVALQAYHAANGSLPPAVIWSPIGEPLGEGVYPIGVIDRVARYGDIPADTIFANWLVLLLPFIDGQTFEATFDPRVPISHQRNEPVRTAEVPVFKCPSDPASNNGQQYDRLLASGGRGNRYARGNYAINIGPDANCLNYRARQNEVCTKGFVARGADLRRDNDAVWGSGIAGANRSFSLGAVTRGLSQTVALDEIRAGFHSLDLRGAWALGQVGASCIARHGLFGPAGRPNPIDCLDRIIGCGALLRELGTVAIHDRGMPCYPDLLSQEVNTLVASRSLHRRGVNTLLCDGSVRWFANDVDPQVWHAMHRRSGVR